MEGQKVVSVRPFFLRDANKPFDDLRCRFFRRKRVSEPPQGTNYEKQDAVQGDLSRQMTSEILYEAPHFSNSIVSSKSKTTHYYAVDTNMDTAG